MLTPNDVVEKKNDFEFRLFSVTTKFGFRPKLSYFMLLTDKSTTLGLLINRATASSFRNIPLHNYIVVTIIFEGAVSVNVGLPNSK